jgi:D-alanine-D-alanine ligase
MKRCTIIYNQPGEGALEDELDVLEQADHIATHLAELGIEVTRKGFTADFLNEMDALVADKPDFVFNLVESISNKGELNYFVPALLNVNAIPYSGNPHDAIFLTTSKVIASRMMKLAGIRTAEFLFPSEFRKLVPGRRYILKPIWEDGSLGITSDSVFYYEPGYEERFRGLSDSHWFIEEFIEGREFNLSMLAGPDGPEIMPTAEIVFVGYDDSRPRIIDFKAKWEMDTFEYENTVREFPGEKLSRNLENSLRSTAMKCWQLFGLRGYARVDMRADSDENVFVVEVNANPCISPEGGFVSATKQANYKFTEVLSRIINDLNR